jgi:hypothetical protein
MTSIPGRPGRSLRWIAWALCVLPLGVLADQPFQQSGGLSSAAATDSTSPDIRPGVGDGGMRGGRHRPPTDQEWQEASALLNRYSPKRMAIVADLPDGPVKQRLRNFIYSRYVQLLKVQDNFPQIFQLQLQRLTIEDNLFDLHRRFSSATGPAKTQLRADLKQQVQALFDNVQQDRQARINRMKTLVADMQAREDAAAQNRESLIEQQLKDVIQNGPKALEREGFQRRNGSGGSAGFQREESDTQPDQAFESTTNPN